MWAILILGIVVVLTVLAPRSGSERGTAKWYDWLLLTLAPLIGGWLLAPTAIGNVLHTVALQWFGDWALLLFFVTLAAVLLKRGDSAWGSMTLGDGFMVFPSLLLGIALYNSSLGADIRTGIEKMQTNAKEYAANVKKKQEETKVKKEEEAKKPLQKLSKDELKQVSWKGGKEILFSVRSDGEWVCEGNIVRDGAFVAGSYSVFIAAGKLTYKSATDFPAPGPRICFKKKDGTFTQEEVVKKTP